MCSGWGGKNAGILLPYFASAPGVGEMLQRGGWMGKDLFSREGVSRIPQDTPSDQAAAVVLSPSWGLILRLFS